MIIYDQMPFRWWHKSSSQPPGVSTGRHAVWQCRICRSPLWVWLLLCAQLFGSYLLLRRILFLWEIWYTLSAFLCRVKRMNGPPGSPGCFIYKHFWCLLGPTSCGVRANMDTAQWMTYDAEVTNKCILGDDRQFTRFLISRKILHYWLDIWVQF